MKKPKSPSLPQGASRPEAEKLWKETIAEYDLDASGLEMLRVAVMSLDKFLKFTAQLEIEGPTYRTKAGTVKKNPLHELIRHERQGFISAMRLLDLDPEPTEKKRVGRPGTYGV
jgi:hypothetical protein